MMNENRLWLIIAVIAVTAFISLAVSNDQEELLVYYSPTATPIPPTSTPTPTPTPGPVTEANTWEPIQSNHDAWENDADAGFNSSNQDLWVESGSSAAGRINIAINFSAVDIPQGATINTATMQGYVNASSRLSSTVYGYDADNGGALSDVTGLTRTTASVGWNTGNVGTGYQVSPSIVSIIQEIVDRVGWVEGNDMTLIVKGNSGSNYNALFDAWDHTGTTVFQLDANFTYQP